MSMVRPRRGARWAKLAMFGATCLNACAAPRQGGELAGAGPPLSEATTGGAPSMPPGEPPLGGGSGQAPAASGSAGASFPEPGAGSGKCVNGVKVPDGSSIETGGTAPDLLKAITHATTPLPPLSGGTLLVLTGGATAAISDPERDRLYLADLSKGAVRSVALDAGDEPGRLIEDAAGRVHVVLRRAGALASIDTERGALLARRAVCPAPRGLAYQKTTDELHVACAGGELLSLPASGGNATRRLRLERDLRDVIVADDGELLVSTFRKAEVLVLAADGTLASRMQAGSGVVPTLYGMQHRTPAVAWRMLSFDPTRGSVLLLHQTGVTDTIDTGPGGYVPDACGAIVQPGLSLLTPGEPTPTVASGLAKLALAIDVALSPDRKKVALAVAGNGLAQGATLIEQPLAVAMPVSPRPCTDATENAIQAPPPGQVVAVSYGPSGVLFAQTREPSALWRSDTGATTSLAADSRSDTGHFLFHANSGGSIACASCHPEGGEDGRVWDFVCAGRRRTQSMRGGIGPTTPLHWDGSEIDMALLLDDVFSNRMVGPLLSDEIKQALQTWVDTIPELPAAASVDATSVARGNALFKDVSVGCATCHSGALLTNNATLDVGTGRALQVPSLRGVAFRSPFMHDGCATTLRDRFTSATCGGGDKHGSTSSLSTSQIDDLVSYLESL